MDFLPTWAVLEFFRKIQLIEYRWIVDRDRDRAERERERSIRGIGSNGYGGQEVPRSADCKMENQERGSVIQSESKDLRTGS